MNYSIFNLETGELSLVVSAPESLIASQYNSLIEVAVAGTYDVAEVYFKNGNLVSKPEAPSTFHVWDLTSKTWKDSRTLQRYKDSKWAEVKQKRSELLYATDWQVTKASESGEVLSLSLKNYRQALRDITLQEDPWNVVWPLLP